MLIFFSVGEPSGDIHGANLIRALRGKRTDVRCVGYGGPRMAAAGCELHEDLTRLAVMWFLRVLLNLHTFLRLVVRADRFFRRHRPDVVVLVDYPGFNWWIARRAKAHGIPVVYYSPPQVWAWARWRLGKLRRLTDLILSGLPFETAWLNRQGCRAVFVGHPYFDEVRQHAADREFVDHERRLAAAGARLVAILPGSRTQEVQHNFPHQLRAALAVARQVPGVRFGVACYKPQHAELVRTMIARQNGAESLAIEVYVGRTPELMALAECAVAVSGSVSLELLHHRLPTVIVYHLSPLALRVGRAFMHVKYITLVNLLSDPSPDVLDGGYNPQAARAPERPFPEYLTSDDPSADMAGHVVRWLTDKSARAATVAQLDALCQEIAHGGAATRAAGHVLDIAHIAYTRRTAPPLPHYHGATERPAA